MRLANLLVLLGGAQLIASTSLTASGPSGTFTPSQFVSLPTIGGQPSGNPLGGQDLCHSEHGTGWHSTALFRTRRLPNASTPGLGSTTPAGSHQASSTLAWGLMPNSYRSLPVRAAGVTVGGVGLFPGNFFSRRPGGQPGTQPTDNQRPASDPHLQRPWAGDHHLLIGAVGIGESSIGVLIPTMTSSHSSIDTPRRCAGCWFARLWKRAC